MAKYLKISKHDENDFPQGPLLLIMSLLTVPIVEISHILAVIYFIFLKTTFSFLKEYLALGYNFLKFSDFRNISLVIFLI